MSDIPVPREIGMLSNQAAGLKNLISVKLDEIMALAQIEDGRALDAVREEIHNLADRYCDKVVAVQVELRRHFGID